MDKIKNWWYRNWFRRRKLEPQPLPRRIKSFNVCRVHLQFFITRAKQKKCEVALVIRNFDSSPRLLPFVVIFYFVAFIELNFDTFEYIRRGRHNQGALHWWGRILLLLLRSRKIRTRTSDSLTQLDTFNNVIFTANTFKCIAVCCACICIHTQLEAFQMLNIPKVIENG